MISIFDLSVSMAGSKVLTDKAHHDGYPVRRNRSDVVKKAVDHVGVHVDDKPITSEPRKTSSSKKSGGTPMKMHIAQEMLKEPESKRKPPSVVARLMGLDDALPAQQPVPAAKRSSQDCHPRSKSTGALRGRRQQELQEDGYLDRPRSCEVHSCSYEKECKDVYQIWQRPSRTNRFTDQPLRKGKFDENQNEKRMDLVRQKFMEAKRLATDEKLLQSKEFHDALDVLSSNRDLFLKFLEEPNSLFSKHIKELHTSPSPIQTKRITVLKPSNYVEAKHLKKQQYPVATGSEWEMDKPNPASDFSQPKAECLSQPTRIVVLKPSPAKTHDTTATETTPTSPELLQHSDFYSCSEAGEALGSREIAKEITRQMRESTGSHRRGESLLSSVLSNGYVGDESSFDKSENDYIGKEEGNFIDSEVRTPSSRHSWEYNNRIDSPYSLSSFSRTSFSPESSVTREAKKRLSERWAMVALNGTNQEQTKVWRGSSTLRDMLAISEVKKENRNNGVSTVSSSRSCGGEEDLRAPSACMSIGRTKDGDGGDISPKNFSRSKSVPVSSSVYKSIGLDVEASDPHISKSSIVAKEVAKSKSSKSSFKGKVSSFFSRNKKSGKKKIASSPIVGTDEKFQPSRTESVCNDSDDLIKSVHDTHLEESPLVNSVEESGKASSPTSGNDGPKQGTCSSKAVISLGKLGITENLSGNQDKFRTSGNSTENQDQPSPTSVLDPLFEDVHNESPSPETVNAGLPQALSRSAPIESIARSLSWDDTHFGTSSPNPPPRLLGGDEEEQERFMFVQNLLSSAGLDTEKVNTVFTRWHSPDSPLDPVLLVKLLDRKEEGEKRREWRSSHRLMFDCVNAALLDVGQAAILSSYPWAGACCEARKDSSSGALVAAEVWDIVRDRFSGERNQVSFKADNSSLVVDRLLRKELVGRGWAELVQTEIDEISEGIERKVLDDLIGEALADFTGDCLS